LNNKLANAIDDCLYRIEAGETPEDCLRDYPELGAELRQMLELTGMLGSLKPVVPDDSFINSAWQRIQAAAENKGQISFRQKLTVWLGGFNALRMQPRLAISSLAIAILLIATTVFLQNDVANCPLLAAECTLSVLSGESTVQTAVEAEPVPARDGMELGAGSIITTGPDASAVLTFANGSTLKLEPATTVLVETLAADSQGNINDIVLKQDSGETWSNVAKVTEGSRYIILTPSATAEVMGTQFVTGVDKTGNTIVQTAEGEVNVSSGGQTVPVSAGRQGMVSSGQAPQASAPIAPPQNSLQISFSSTVVGSVVDPDGASTGYLPGGFAFNQIKNSATTSPSDGNQIITVPEPQNGQYTIVFRGVTDGSANIQVRGMNQENLAFSFSKSADVAEGDEYKLTVRVRANNRELTRTGNSDIEPLGEDAGEKVVVPPGVQKQMDDEDDSGQGNSGNDKDDKDDSGQGNSGNDKDDNDNSGQGNSSSDKDDNDNSGQGNSGSDNSGQGNSGSDNSGQGNSGSDNSGQGNSGNDNSGRGNNSSDKGDKPGKGNNESEDDDQEDPD
jgi:FecR-like protein